MKKSLNMVNCPIMLFQGRLDTIIKQNIMDFILTDVASKNKKKIWLEHNSHPIVDSPDHNQIVSEIHNFISEICP